MVNLNLILLLKMVIIFRDVGKPTKKKHGTYWYKTNSVAKMVNKTKVALYDYLLSLYNTTQLIDK